MMLLPVSAAVPVVSLHSHGDTPSVQLLRPRQGWIW